MGPVFCATTTPTPIPRCAPIAISARVALVHAHAPPKSQILKEQPAHQLHPVSFVFLVYYPCNPKDVFFILCAYSLG